MLRSPVVRFAVALLVFVLHALSPRVADAQAIRGTLLGTVTDKTGGVLPGVTVTVTNTETGVMQNTVSDAQGRYSVSDLLPGTYSVESSLTGFQKVIREGIRVVVGAQVPVDFSLGPSTLSETVTVSAAAPVVDTVSAALGTVVEQKQMTELPLVDRSYSRLIVLARSRRRAWRSCPVDAARMMGADRESGSIGEGKFADVIAVRGDFAAAHRRAA